jgi:AraC family transcriptional regulator
MIVLTKGEYLGSVHSTTSAEGVLIGITEYQEDQILSPMHYHENPHLSFVLKGNMCVKRKKLTGSDQAMESSSFMRSGEVHQNSIHSTHCKNMNLELELDFFKRYSITEDRINLGLLKDQPGTALLMVRLYRELLIADEHLSDSLHMLLLGAAARWRNNLLQFPSWVNTVRELLNDRWYDQVTLNEIALAAGVHPVTVCKYFTRYFGMGFGEYRRQLKVERAIHLIAAGNIPLTEIGYTCGFFDQSHFVRAFKDFTAMLPKDFRKA